jgi:hypothetical protein
VEKEFIPYEIALALKELGFDEPCIAFYNGKFLDFKITSNGIESPYIDSTMKIGQCVNAPTLSQAFRWFRENYFIYPSIIQLRGWVNSYKIIKWDSSCDATTVYDSNNYQTYEEAELECLKKLIEICKKN